MGAIISACGQYRYALSRPPLTGGKSKPPLGFVMLNPSTADAEVDDPTIRRCRYFAERGGFGGILVVNVFAFRATNPEALWIQDDPVGPKNAAALAKAAQVCTDIVYAWGVNAPLTNVAATIKALRGSGKYDAWCLGSTQAGQPRHPLYIRNDAPMWPYPPAFWHHPESACVFVGSHAEYALAKSDECVSINYATYCKLKERYDGNSDA